MASKTGTEPPALAQITPTSNPKTQCSPHYRHCGCLLTLQMSQIPNYQHQRVSAHAVSCVQHSPKPVFPELMPTHPSKLSSNVTSSGKPSGIPQPRSNFSATVSHSIMFLSFVEIISVYNCVSPLDHKLYESKSVCGVCQMRHTIFECI